MLSKKAKILVKIAMTIMVGLLSRQIEWIPVFVGDILYAVMMYFIIELILFRKKSLIVAVFALLLTYLIEFSQLYKADWIIGIRSTLLGKLVLGQGFLWSDIYSYTFGIILVYKLSQLSKTEEKY
ncbi:DUF2809 domain-containing protein [Fusibacter sp. JL216-2]|uniref:ribosomal maturation YjgA family protein n=1 Tax=Fusibacter sp. JL216-2 TaxID=3071453 RepID=UPI003D3371B6